MTYLKLFAGFRELSNPSNILLNMGKRKESLFKAAIPLFPAH